MNLDAGQGFNFLPIPTDVHFGFGAVALAAGPRARARRRPGVRGDRPGRAGGRGSSTGSPSVLDRRRRSIRRSTTRSPPIRARALICEAVERLKTAGADVVVGVGGGSALDTAKAVAALATNPGSPLDYVGLHKVKNRPLPTIAIPTTAGTGSEVSLWSVFTDDERKLKVAIGGVLLYPAVAAVRSGADDRSCRRR